MDSASAFKFRFCPSPTGLMHLGNLRTALFNVLLAKSYCAQNKHASFLLRIEDTDAARSETEFAHGLMHDLRWLDLHWDEGPDQEGQHGPYYQSQRHEIYEQYYQQLIQQGHAYWCYCTDTELTITRKLQLAAGQPPRYPGTCRHLTEQQRQAKEAQGIKPALRFRVPDNEVVQFEDLIQGPKTFSSQDLGDFIIRKNDGFSSFMFCNAVDDALMKVTHVVRGEDHLTNTPRQLLILKVLGLTAPAYAHMPLILGFDGKPLSKRNGSQTIQSMREQGYFPLAILNYLSRLGHHFENDKLLPLAELGQFFSLNHIGRSPARFDEAQLKHWQKEAVLQLSEEAFIQWIAKEVENWVPQEKLALFVSTIKQNIMLPLEAQDWAMQLLSDKWQPEPEAQNNIAAAGKEFLTALISVIETEGENYQAVVQKLGALTHKKGKALFMPLRSAVTGRGAGPELAKIFQLMGKERLLSRVQMVAATL